MENQKNLSATVRAIALPLALQSLLGYAVNMLDTVMIGQLENWSCRLYPWLTR